MIAGVLPDRNLQISAHRTGLGPAEAQQRPPQLGTLWEVVAKGPQGAQGAEASQIRAAGQLQQQGFRSVTGGVARHHIGPQLLCPLLHLVVAPMAGTGFAGGAARFRLGHLDRQAAVLAPAFQFIRYNC